MYISADKGRSIEDRIFIGTSSSGKVLIQYAWPGLLCTSFQPPMQILFFWGGGGGKVYYGIVQVSSWELLHYLRSLRELLHYRTPGHFAALIRSHMNGLESFERTVGDDVWTHKRCIWYFNILTCEVFRTKLHFLKFLLFKTDLNTKANTTKYISLSWNPRSNTKILIYRIRFIKNSENLLEQWEWLLKRRRRFW